MATAASGQGAGSAEPRSFAPEPPHRLVAGDPPNGAVVFDSSGEKVGVIDSVAIDQATGKVAFAVLRHGGFLGLRRRCRPIPWSLLAYDARSGGYVVPLERATVEAGPSFEGEVLGARDDRGFREKVHRYYAGHGATPYWT